MSASATTPPRLPAQRKEEGLYFWEQLVKACKENVQAINCALSSHGRTANDFIELRADEQLQLIRTGYPSTTLHARIEFESWGPVIKVSLRGHQRPDFGFYPEEFEMPLATECEGCLVAIFDEGKSFTPSDLAAYLVQHFRRCYPHIALPCSGHAEAEHP